MYLLNERETERERGTEKERERLLMRKSNPLISVIKMFGNIQPFDQYDYTAVN